MDDLEAVFLEHGLAAQRQRLVVGRSDRDLAHAEGLEGRGGAAQRRDEGNAGPLLLALCQLGIAIPPEHVAGGGVREHDHVGFDAGDRFDRLVHVLELARRARLQVGERPHRAARDHAREVHRYALWRELDHLPLDRWRSRRDHETQSCSPALHAWSSYLVACGCALPVCAMKLGHDRLDLTPIFGEPALRRRHFCAPRRRECSEPSESCVHAAWAQRAGGELSWLMRLRSLRAPALRREHS